MQAQQFRGYAFVLEDGPFRSSDVRGGSCLGGGAGCQCRKHSTIETSCFGKGCCCCGNKLRWPAAPPGRRPAF